MRVLRAILGALLWIAAAVVGLLGALLSVTVIGLPLGIPLLLWARRLFKTAVRLMLPTHLAHPVRETKSSGRKKGEQARKDSSKAAGKLTEKSGKAARKASKTLPDTSAVTKKARKSRKQAKKRTKRVRRALR